MSSVSAYLIIESLWRSKSLPDILSMKGSQLRLHWQSLDILPLTESLTTISPSSESVHRVTTSSKFRELRASIKGCFPDSHPFVLITTNGLSCIDTKHHRKDNTRGGQDDRNPGKRLPIAPEANGKPLFWTVRRDRSVVFSGPRAPITDWRRRGSDSSANMGTLKHSGRSSLVVFRVRKATGGKMRAWIAVTPSYSILLLTYIHVSTRGVWGIIVWD
ncbi:hypothetical protein ASPTUDRAFT_33424 [Aspergillus tubingensis CBS 134.48]|uniref:Uncharacterized protein n=1 Tax=Aspergillus tubingensis (strain CBS 134.48) TaxID=767770 RepID=A0A1L9MU80_ASPTC|nr:hypothetical protein ASPTUDRAFT_33424 [Aspergillus tubingensis CBS 134.48]